MAEVEREVRTLIATAFRDREHTGSYDFEALETYTREVMHRCGAHVLEGLLEVEDGQTLGRSCPCGGVFHNKKRQVKTLRTLLDKLRIVGTHQRCSGCGTWRTPQDIVLDVIGTGFSPGLRRAMAQTASDVCFEKSALFLNRLAGVSVNAKDVERVAEAIGKDMLRRQEQDIEAAQQTAAQEIATVYTQVPDTLYIMDDGTGVPVRRKETEGRKGKHSDGIARTREAKLGVVFDQVEIDSEGNPIRAAHSTSYVGKIESVDTFGPRLYEEARRRGIDQARRVVAMGDGAPWIWNMADTYFPQAIQIVDYFHAREHLSTLAKALFPENEIARHLFEKPLAELLWQGDIPALTMALRETIVADAKNTILNATIEYFNTNHHRMRYRYFREQNLFIGSGVVEAGCRSLIGERLKRSGMHWTVVGANAIIALRCCIESNQFENYWENRRPMLKAA
jgi:hypothetical protein